MREENQTNQDTFSARDDIRERLSSVRNYRASLRHAKETQTQNSLDSNSNNFYAKSLDVNNEELSKRYNQASQSSLVAGMIKDYAQKNGDDWSDLNTPQEILAEYFRINPGDDVYNKIMDFTQSDRDAEEFGIEMGWIQKDIWDKVWDKAGNIVKNFASVYETGGDFIRNLINGSLDEIEQGTVFNPSSTDYTMSARENYAQIKYGKDYYSLTPEQKEEANYILSTEEGMNMYKPTAQRAVSRGLEAGLDAFFTMYAPTVKASLSVASEIPVLRNIVQGIGNIAEFGGYWINKLPLLKQFRNSLQTPEEQEQWDEFVGTLGLMKLLQKRGKDGRITSKEAVLTELDPKTMVKEFQERVINLPSDIKETVGSLRDGKATPQKLQETAGKIANTKTVEETQSATRGLQDIDFEGIKTYKELEDALTAKGNEIEALEDVEYAKDPRKFKPEETRGMKTFTKDGYSSSVMLKPVEDGINLLKDFYEGSPEKLAQLDLIEQKFQNEGLTKAEINNISRAIAQEYETYKARGQQKTSIAAKNVEEIRRAVKNFAREGNEELVNLDKLWSDNMNTKAMIKDVQNEIVKTKNKLADKNIFQKTMGKLGDIIDFFGGKDLLTKILPKLAGDNTMNAIARQKQLKSMLSKFKRLNKRLGGAKTESEVETIIDEFNAEITEGPIEGEVLSSDYLEDMSK